MALKDVWKCAAEVSGALSVEISGMMWMLKLSATSSDFQTQVCSLLLAYAKNVLFHNCMVRLLFWIDLDYRDKTKLYAGSAYVMQHA